MSAARIYGQSGCDGNWLLYFTWPIALLFFVLTALGLFSPMIFNKITSRRLKASQT